ncbi:MAG: hypothetical protein AABX52_02035 [Nanoarchaeota archaeon]
MEKNSIRWHHKHICAQTALLLLLLFVMVDGSPFSGAVVIETSAVQISLIFVYLLLTLLGILVIIALHHALVSLRISHSMQPLVLTLQGSSQWQLIRPPPPPKQPLPQRLFTKSIETDHVSWLRICIRALHSQVPGNSAGNSAILSHVTVKSSSSYTDLPKQKKAALLLNNKSWFKKENSSLGSELQDINQQIQKHIKTLYR